MISAVIEELQRTQRRGVWGVGGGVVLVGFLEEVTSRPGIVRS